ncbi:hypothetical protein [Prevotella sp. 10(H)]|uniref:hypothetical protein n=1 Tax=Prevotella sp. 10(H) TaxID=1158294 RepID=UPI0004A72E73|nr:hypothetical protein [Prevotella sp. 10(H)]
MIGIANSEFEEERSSVPLSGSTEILPGRITTDRVVSADGKSFMDLANNAFRIGDESSSLDWNVSKDEQLSIRNANFEINNSKGEIISRIDGESGAAVFGKGKNQFKDDGSFSFADGNFLYDIIDGLSVIGKFQSNKNGNRIIVNPETRCLEMYNKSNEKILSMSFTEYENGIIQPLFECYTYSANKEKLYSTLITGGSVTVHNITNNVAYSIDASSIKVRDYGSSGDEHLYISYNDNTKKMEIKMKLPDKNPISGESNWLYMKDGIVRIS